MNEARSLRKRSRLPPVTAALQKLHVSAAAFTHDGSSVPPEEEPGPGRC